MKNLFEGMSKGQKIGYIVGKVLLIVFIITLVVATSSCTENSRAKNFGGKAQLELPQGQKLVVVTWKDDALWYLTRPMRPNETAETYTFQEKSSWGVWEGTYTIKEKK